MRVTKRVPVSALWGVMDSVGPPSPTSPSGRSATLSSLTVFLTPPSLPHPAPLPEVGVGGVHEGAAEPQQHRIEVDKEAYEGGGVQMWAVGEPRGGEEAKPREWTRRGPPPSPMRGPPSAPCGAAFYMSLSLSRVGPSSSPPPLPPSSHPLPCDAAFCMSICILPRSSLPSMAAASQLIMASRVDLPSKDCGEVW